MAIMRVSIRWLLLAVAIVAYGFKTFDAQVSREELAVPNKRSGKVAAGQGDLIKEIHENVPLLIDREASIHIEQTSKPQASNEPDNRPVLVIHIGPHKTATSTIQCELTYYRNYLQQTGNFTYLGRQYPQCVNRQNPVDPKYGIKYDIDTRSMIDCLDKHTSKDRCSKKPEWRKFRKALYTVAQANQNAIISDEAFARMLVKPQNLEVLFRTASRYFQIRVVIVYRHYWSWFLSYYNELYKPHQRRPHFQQWPGEEGGRRILPLVEYYAKIQQEVQEGSRNYQQAVNVTGNFQVVAGILNMHPVAYLHKRWVDPTIPMAPREGIVVNMHQEGDVFFNFVKQAMSEELAANLEQHKQQLITNGVKFPDKENPSLNLDFDRLAVDARQQGLVPQNGRLSRRLVAYYLEYHFPKQVNITKMPQICLDEAQIQEFQKRSLFLEETVFRKLQKQQHIAEFEEAKHRNKFCNLDTKQLLADEGVQELFRSLNNLLDLDKEDMQDLFQILKSFAERKKRS